MRNSLLYVALAILVALTTPLSISLASDAPAPHGNSTVETSATPSDYGVQPGDLLTISVWKEEGLQGDTLVRPDGGISFPLVGDISAAGKSVKQITVLITERLSKYIPDPVVTVTIKALTGNVVYVIGKVNRPGEFPATHNVDVMQALSMAGGTNTFAALNDIKILRRIGGKQSAISFRYGDVESGKKLEQNIILQSGDIVVVP